MNRTTRTVLIVATAAVVTGGTAHACATVTGPPAPESPVYPASWSPTASPRPLPTNSVPPPAEPLPPPGCPEHGAPAIVSLGRLSGLDAYRARWGQQCLDYATDPVGFWLAHGAPTSRYGPEVTGAPR